VKVIAYPDHYNYTMRDADHIRRVTRGLPIITTEKDAIKLVSAFDASELRVLKQKVVIEDGEERLRAMLERVL
jgi:tetraacyldisaccharide-1-P 4'-kinase